MQANYTVSAVGVGTLCCLSDATVSRPQLATDMSDGPGTMYFTSFAGCTGTWYYASFIPVRQAHQWTVLDSEHVSLAMIIDGTSQTFIFGETHTLLSCDVPAGGGIPPASTGTGGRRERTATQCSAHSTH